MWRIAVLLFSGLLLCLIGSLFMLRREPSTTHWIVFVGDDHLYRMTAEGESLRPIVADKVAMFAVSPTENSIAYFHTSGGVTSVKETNLLGFRNEILSAELNPRWLTWSTDSTRLAYFADDDLAPQNLVTIDMATHRREVLLAGPMLLVEPAVSGERVAAYGPNNVNTGLWIADSSTDEFTSIIFLVAYPLLPPTFSPDGKWIAFAATNVYTDIYSPRTSVGPPRGSDLWVVSDDGQAPRLITVDLDVESKIFWTDGGLVFAAVDKAQSRTRTAIYRVHPDGSELTQLTSTDFDATPTDVSPDSKWILAVARSSTSDNQISLLRISMDGTTVEEIHVPVHQVRDAQWVAPLEFDWNSTFVLLTGLVSGGVYVAYRRFVV